MAIRSVPVFLVMMVGTVSGHACHPGVIAACVLAPTVFLLFVFLAVLFVLYKKRKLVCYDMEYGIAKDDGHVDTLKRKSTDGFINHGYKSEHKNEKESSDLKNTKTNVKVLTLIGREPYGLGLSLSRNQNMEIVVNAIKSGPAMESDIAKVGDTIKSLKIYFDKMNLEDALHFFSYAGKYRVDIEMVKGTVNKECSETKAVETPDIREIISDESLHFNGEQILLSTNVTSYHRNSYPDLNGSISQNGEVIVDKTDDDTCKEKNKETQYTSETMVNEDGIPVSDQFRDEHAQKSQSTTKLSEPHQPVHANIEFNMLLEKAEDSNHTPLMESTENELLSSEAPPSLLTAPLQSNSLRQSTEDLQLLTDLDSTNSEMNIVFSEKTVTPSLSSSDSDEIICHEEHSANNDSDSNVKYSVDAPIDNLRNEQTNKEFEEDLSAKLLTDTVVDNIENTEECLPKIESKVSSDDSEIIQDTPLNIETYQNQHNDSLNMWENKQTHEPEPICVASTELDAQQCTSPISQSVLTQGIAFKDDQSFPNKVDHGLLPVKDKDDTFLMLENNRDFQNKTSSGQLDDQKNGSLGVNAIIVSVPEAVTENCYDATNDNEHETISPENSHIDKNMDGPEICEKESPSNLFGPKEVEDHNIVDAMLEHSPSEDRNENGQTSINQSVLDMSDSVPVWDTASDLANISRVSSLSSLEDSRQIHSSFSTAREDLSRLSNNSTSSRDS